MIHSLLIAATPSAQNPIALWSWQQTVPFIVGASLLVLIISSRTIEEPHVGPKMPLGPLAPLFNDISLAGFLGAVSFGHILGVLAIFGLSGILNNY